ncbi:hypothetical protein BD414DRAFT_326725 [Trametes punicea]|nr:hypothetical protein BD414DRAFT_326725 [Trametes punicea]
MAEIHGDGGPLPPIPDDLTVAQFILDTQHPLRPVPNRLRPWLIEEMTGREIGPEEVRARIFGLANALKIRWNIGEDDVVCLFSPNHVDYAVVIWAAHKFGAIATTANPAYTLEEITYQLELTKARVIFVHPSNLSVALDAARAVGIPADRVVLFEPVSGSQNPSVQELVVQGLREVQQFSERRLKPGEGKTKLALLCFSSGTTGKPKAAMITHYAVIANLIQAGQYMRLTDERMPANKLIYRPGSVGLGVLPFFHVYGLLVILFGGIFFGATVLVSQKFQLERMLESIQRYRVTHLYLVPPMAVLLCKSPIVKNYDIRSVYFFIIGAAPVSAELTEQLVRVLPDTCRIG